MYIDDRGRKVFVGQEAIDHFVSGLRRLKENRKLHYRTTFQGLPVSIENRKGSIRRGTDPDGEEWETKHKRPYGYIPGTKGPDGDAVDVFVGPNEHAAFAYVIHINNPETEEYDEDKVMLGFDSEEDALRCFRQHYDEPEKFYSGMDVIPMWKFRDKVFIKKHTTKKLVASMRESGSGDKDKIKLLLWVLAKLLKVDIGKKGSSKKSSFKSAFIPSGMFASGSLTRESQAFGNGNLGNPPPTKKPRLGDSLGTDQTMKKSILGHHQDIMVDPNVREGGPGSGPHKSGGFTTFYHGTHPSSVEKILKQGLEPGHKVKGGLAARGTVYLSSTSATAKKWGETATTPSHREKPAVLKIRVPDRIASQITADPRRGSVAGTTKNDYTFKGTIPGKYISVVDPGKKAGEKDIYGNKIKSREGGPGSGPRGHIEQAGGIYIGAMDNPKGGQIHGFRDPQSGSTMWMKDAAINSPQDVQDHMDKSRATFAKKEAREHGVKGMKWGVRKVRQDSAGQKHPVTGKPQPASKRPVDRTLSQMGRSQSTPQTQQNARFDQLRQQGQQLIDQHNAENQQQSQSGGQMDAHSSHSRLTDSLKELGWKVAEIAAGVTGMGGAFQVARSIISPPGSDKKYNLTTNSQGRHSVSEVPKKSSRSRTRTSIHEAIESFGGSRMREGKIYYARPLQRYKSSKESDDVDFLEGEYPDDSVTFPRTRRHAELGMGYFHKKIDKAKEVVITGLHKRKVTAGVASEARHALKKGIPVRFLRNGKLRTVVGIENIEGGRPGGHYARVIFRKRRKRK